MGFFGNFIEEESVDIDIPNGYTLTLLKACCDVKHWLKSTAVPNASSVKDRNSVPQSRSVLFCKTEHEEMEFVLSIFDCEKGKLESSLGHVFTPDDGIVTFRTVGGGIHLTGKWDWIEEGDIVDGSESCADSDDPQSDSDNEECPQLIDPDILNTGSLDTLIVDSGRAKNLSSKVLKSDVSCNESEVSAKGKKSSSKRKANLETIENSETIESTRNVHIETNLSANKTDNSEKLSVEIAEVKKSKKGLKIWKVKPVGDEGLEVILPKRETRSGITLTDYVMGKGLEPKAGAKLKIIYEGLFPDGSVFDSKIARSKPFVFRKGTGQVIKGLELGIEGMRIGGSREIIVPPSLGYGAQGLGVIPANQTLIFRVTLLGVLK